MARLMDLLEIIDANEINLIASDGPKGIVQKNDIDEMLLQNQVVGIGVDTVTGKPVLMIRLSEKSPAYMDGYSFEVGV